MPMDRQGVFELMPVTEEVRELTLQRASAGKIREVASRQGMNSLRDDGWRLVGEGKTTVEDVLRDRLLRGRRVVRHEWIGGHVPLQPERGLRRGRDLLVLAWRRRRLRPALLRRRCRHLPHLAPNVQARHREAR